MNVIISQAMATGLPVIVTNHSGLPDQVENNVNGFIVNEGDPNDLAQAIIRFITGKERWPEMSLESRKLVERKYNTEILIDRQILIYKDLILK